MPHWGRQGHAFGIAELQLHAKIKFVTPVHQENITSRDHDHGGTGALLVT